MMNLEQIMYLDAEYKKHFAILMPNKLLLMAVIVFIQVLCSTAAWAQTYTMPITSTTYTTCTGTLYDSGGSSGSYSLNENRNVTLTATSGQITLTFTEFNLETNYDFLRIYDGTNTSGTQLLNGTGSVLPSAVTSTTGSLHIVFTSDDFVVLSGWAATIACSGSGSGSGSSCSPTTFGIVQPGQMVGTCATSSQSGFIMGVMDASGLSYNPNSQMPTEWHHPSWTVQNIGNIYFTEFGPDGTIYAPASLFTMSDWGSLDGAGNTVWQYGGLGGGANDLNAAGTIYRMDPTTGAPMVWAQLPQQNFTFLNSNPGGLPTRTTGPGLGGVAYDTTNDYLYVVNMEDGKIYAFDANDTGPFPLTFADAIDIYDPLSIDNGLAGMPPLGDRPFGLDIYNGRLYYTVHNYNSAAANGMLIVRSVAIGAGGAIDVTDQLEVMQEITYNYRVMSDYVVADVEINSDGRMAVGGFSTMHVYTLSGYYNTQLPDLYNHAAGVYVFDLNSGAPGSRPRLKFSSVGQETFTPGDASTAGTTNYTSTGGVSWNTCNEEDILWMAGGDFLNEDSNFGIIGYNYNSLQNIEAIQETSTNYIQFIFAADSPTADQKGNGGDVDIFNPEIFCVCNLCNITANPGACAPATNQYTLTGTLDLSLPPTTGTLTVSVSGGGSQTFNAPFTSPQTYSIAGLNSDGANHTVTAIFSDNLTCTATATYAAPSSCLCTLSASATGTPVSCNGDSNGTASVTASGNTGIVTYLWSNGATTSSISSLSAGIYNITVSEPSGCTATTSYTVTEPSSLSVTCSSTDATTIGGNDGTASVSASGGTLTYTYLWSNGATTSSISGVFSGTYDVTVSDNNSCTSVCSTTVQDPNCALSASATGTPVSCNGGSNGTASVTASGNTGIVTYLWSNGATTSSISGLSAGIYNITVSEPSGCAATSSYTVTEPSSLSVTCSSTDATTIGGNDGTASVSVIGGTSTYTYLWSNGATTSSIGNLVAGTYTVTVADDNDCTEQCSTIVQEPNVSANPDLSLTKTVSTAIAQIGEQVTFTLTLTNDNGIDATGVVVSDYLPTGVTFVSSSPSAGVIHNNGVVTWNVGTFLGVDAPKTLDIVVSVNAAANNNTTGEGMHINSTEITAMNEVDQDSTPNNNVPGEDDIDQACFSVPIILCSDSAMSTITITANSAMSYQWYVSTDNGANYTALAGQMNQTLVVDNTLMGGDGVTKYFKVAYNGADITSGCGNVMCCPIIVTTATCIICPPVRCVTIAIIKNN